MAYKKVSGSRTVEIQLDGSVYTVNFGCSYNYYAVRNDSRGTIYVSTADKSCTPNNDGVVSIPSGGGYVHYNGFGGSSEIYISGTGGVLVVAQDDGVCPFRLAVKGGDSGGSVDLTAYLPKKLPDVYMSAGTKTMKQVCDEIKSWWSENYNNFSVFRFLGGFESDVIDGWNSNKFLGSDYTWQLTPINNYFNTADNGTFILSAIATSDSVLVYIVGLHSKAWAAPKKIVTGKLTDEDIAKLNSITPEMIEKLRNL